MDFKDYLSRNKVHLYKNLLKLEDIQPNHCIKVLDATEMPTKDKKTGAKWELEVTVDTVRHYWRISASLFQQIAEFCNKNNADVFHIVSKRKARVGKVKCWILDLSGKFPDSMAMNKTQQSDKRDADSTPQSDSVSFGKGNSPLFKAIAKDNEVLKDKIDEDIMTEVWLRMKGHIARNEKAQLIYLVVNTLNEHCETTWENTYKYFTELLKQLGAEVKPPVITE